MTAKFLFQESSAKGGRMYNLVKRYDANGSFQESSAKGGRRYNLVKIYA